jgi:aspartate/methionine/tyrosine aminotransferase
MKLAKFLLDEWLEGQTEDPNAIQHHLASSTGPHWTLKDVLALEPGAHERILGMELMYSRATGAPELRDELARMLGSTREEIQITTGASEALHLLFAWAAEKGGNVVLPHPCFPPMQLLPSGLGLEVRSYRLRREAGFAVDLDEVRRLVDEKTRVLLVNSPHNPTGAVLSKEELTALHDIAAERGILFICDEVYSPIATGAPPPSAAGLPHATVVGDFSKALCLSGLRIGFIRETDARRRAYCLNAREMFTVSNSPLDEAIGAVAVRHRERLFENARKTAVENSKELDAFLARHGDLFGCVPARGGMTAFPWLLSGANARPLCLELAGKGVLLAPGDCFGAPEHVRIGFGATPPAAYRRALARMDEILGERRAAA